MKSLSEAHIRHVAQNVFSLENTSQFSVCPIEVILSGKTI